MRAGLWRSSLPCCAVTPLTTAPAIDPFAVICHKNTPCRTGTGPRPTSAGNTRATTAICAAPPYSRWLVKEVRLAFGPPTLGSQTLEQAATKQPDGTWMVNGIALAEPTI